MTSGSPTDEKARPLKVAQVVGSAQGGVMSCVMNYFRNIDRSRVQFHFYTYAPSVYDDEIRALGGEVFHFPNIFKVWKSIPALRKMFKRHNYDIVHAHMTTRSSFVLKAAKQAHIPVRICHSHSTAHKSEGLGYIVKNLLKPYAVKYATHLAGCGKLSISWMYGKKAKDAFFLHNAIDLSRFNMQNRVVGEDKKIGFVGRFAFQKNLEFLIESFALLCKRRNDVSLMLVGDGPDKTKLQKLSEKLAPQKVVFCNETSRPEDVYKQLDLFVMTSRHEGLPLVAVEAQSCGTPCLLSDNITDEVDIGGQVVFLPLTDKTLWAETMDKMLELSPQPADAQGCGYDIATESHKLLDYYLSISPRKEE